MTRISGTAPLALLFERLVAEGPEAPGYAQLHMRLVTYFRLRFPAAAESLADEVMDRLARRLHEGTIVQNLASYTFGIARLVSMEASARQRKERETARDALTQLELTRSEPEVDPALPALRACLYALGPESTGVILEYYAADSGPARIARRQALAERLGLSLNALRNRALRLRSGLEKCVRERLQARDETMNSDTRGILSRIPDGSDADR